jgi:hypothetical protein
MGIEAVTVRMEATLARLAGWAGWHDRQGASARQDPADLWRAGDRDAGRVGGSAGQPSRLRSFDPARVADLEYRAWVAYYRHDWHRALMAFVGLIRMGFGMNWCRTLRAAWLVLRAIKLWAPLPDNDPDGARAYMRRFYALVRLSHGEPASPAKAAEFEVDWWRVHRQVQYSTVPGCSENELVESVTRLYCYLFGEPETGVRPAAWHRVRAMGLSDQWVSEGCLPDSPLLPLVRGALVRAYAALLAAVHH